MSQPLDHPRDYFPWLRLSVPRLPFPPISSPSPPPRGRRQLSALSTSRPWRNESFRCFCSMLWTPSSAIHFTMTSPPSSSAFFDLMSMRELLEEKHPTAWVEFEKGLIDEIELGKKFFKDGRAFDLEGLKDCMRRGYSYVDGIEELLQALKQNNYELHAFTNYPIWYKMIEEKLELSKYLSWTFCSCLIGKRKPAPDSYAVVVHLLNVEPASCIFIDDRVTNVEAAVNAGMVGIHFKNADSLKQDLSSLGVVLEVLNH